MVSWGAWGRGRRSWRSWELKDEDADQDGSKGNVGECQWLDSVAQVTGGRGGGRRSR